MVVCATGSDWVNAHQHGLIGVLESLRTQMMLIFFFFLFFITLKVLVATIDAQWEWMGYVGSARYKPALLPPCLTIRVLSYSS